MIREDSVGSNAPADDGDSSLARKLAHEKRSRNATEERCAALAKENRALKEEVARAREGTKQLFAANQELARLRIQLERELRDARDDAEGTRRALLSAASQSVPLTQENNKKDNDRSDAIQSSDALVSVAVSEAWASRVDELEDELKVAREETERRAKAAAETMVLLDEELRLGTKRLGKLVLRFFETLSALPPPGKDSAEALKALSDEIGWAPEELCAAGFRCKSGCIACTASPKKQFTLAVQSMSKSEQISVAAAATLATHEPTSADDVNRENIAIESNAVALVAGRKKKLLLDSDERMSLQGSSTRKNFSNFISDSVTV